MHEINEISTASPKRKLQKDTPPSRIRRSLEDELFKDLEWKEDPIFTFSLILIVLHHIYVLCSFQFLVRTTSCPVGDPIKGDWLFHGASILGLIFAWIVDRGTNKFDFVLICSTFIFLLSSSVMIVMFFDDNKGTIFCPMARLVYTFVDASMGTTMSLFLEQMKFLKFHLDNDCMLFIVIWGAFFIASLVTVVYQAVIHFYGNVHFYYLIAIVSIVCCINKIILLLLISRRIVKPSIFLNLPYMVTLYFIVQCKAYFKKLTYREEMIIPASIPFDILIVCEQFWKVTGIILFLIPFGISSLIVINAWQNTWNINEDIFIYCRNFTAFYKFSTTVLFPLYYFFLYTRRAKCMWISTELRQMGFGNLIVILSLLCITVMNIRIEESQFPLPLEGYAQIRFFNILNATSDVQFQYMRGQIEPYSFSTFSRIKMDGTFINTAVKVINKQYDINIKTSLVGTSGMSNCYYICHDGIVDLGPEPLGGKFYQTAEGVTFKRSVLYLISDIHDLSFKVKPINERLYFKINSSTTVLIYAYLENGKYRITAKYGNDSVVVESVTVEEASFYALLVSNSTAGLIYRFFTIHTPRFAPTEGMVFVAALFGLGNSIVLFSAVRFVLNECSPMLCTSIIALSYVCQHGISFIHTSLNINKAVGEHSVTFYIAITASLIFLIFYIYAAMTYTYLRDIPFEEEVNSPQVSPINDITDSKDTLR